MEDAFLDSYMEDRLSGGYDYYDDSETDFDEYDDEDEDEDCEPSDDFPMMLEYSDWQYQYEDHCE